ncbi:low temperature requirement protein A [Paenibacillus aurantius]|uniref:Low temperature requirement protein A n=1 Tax=Paenibacillus aurantius TaxID=2918900 RepID=A0AA96RFM8_9BACL|nr:low temperature requirement protein A [Paenibacillus aurantius]WNQ11428.1 low temperature requirement protein A [Paenibacillus aurantius]
MAISIAAHVLAEAHDGHIPTDALLKFPLIFVPLWWAWTGFTLYVNRFGEDSPAQRIVYFIQMLFVIIMAANINVDFEAYYLFFMIGYVGIRLSTVYMYARVWNRHRGLPRQVASYLCLSFLIGSAISFSSVLFPGVAKFYVLYLGIVVDIALPLAGRRLLRRMPVHHHHLMERYGLATIILLGELILVMVDTIRHHSLTLQSGWAVLIGFSIAVAIWWHYFESSEREAHENRAGPGHPVIYGHLFTFLSLGIVSNVIRYALNHELALRSFAWLAWSGFALYVLSTVLIFRPYAASKGLLSWAGLGYPLTLLVLCGIVLLLLPSLTAVYAALAVFFLVYALIAVRQAKMKPASLSR